MDMKKKYVYDVADTHEAANCLVCLHGPAGRPSRTRQRQGFVPPRPTAAAAALPLAGVARRHEQVGSDWAKSASREPTMLPTGGHIRQAS